MNWIFQKIKKHKKALLIVSFLICIFLIDVQSSQAGTTGSMVGDGFLFVVKLLLIQVRNVCAWLFAIAATAFSWAIDPSNISGTNGLLNKAAVRSVWIMVRDTFNIMFILVLLFAAFCTIFQVDRWNLKKVWLNILINALLVNFSYPIARFFIDVSNVAFYYFVNNLFAATGKTVVNGGTIMSSFGSASNLIDILQVGGSDDDIAFLIASIIVVFIMGMTFLIIAALFIVRLTVLTMLVMFSPIGFVGYILPETQGYAEKWWKALFSYSFFAPIMIFVMAIALHILTAVKNENMAPFMSYASGNAPSNLSEFVKAMAYYMIPVIVLWGGIGVAKSSGIAMADTVVNRVKGGGKWLATRPWATGKYAWKQSGVPGGVKKGLENARKSGKIFGFDNKFTRFALKDNREEHEAQIAGGIGGGKKGWNEALENKKKEEFRKKYKEEADKYDDKSYGELVHDIYKADLLNEKEGQKNAMKVAAMLHHLKSDSSKKDAYEASLRENIFKDPIHLANMHNMRSEQKEAYAKVEVAKHWTALNTKSKQALKVATMNKEKHDITEQNMVSAEPKPVAQGGSFSGGGGI